MNSLLEELYSAHAEALRKSGFCGAIERPVFGEGAKGATLMLIGEAPGAQETIQGRPFVGAAGKQLDELLQGVSLDRADIFITNAVKFRPTDVQGKKNRTPNRSVL